MDDKLTPILLNNRDRDPQFYFKTDEDKIEQRMIFTLQENHIVTERV